MTVTDEMTMSEARHHLGMLVEQARTTGEPMYLSRHGKRVVAIIDAAVLEKVIALAEDMIDVRTADEAIRDMNTTGLEPIPWEQVKAELGLT